MDNLKDKAYIYLKDKIMSCEMLPGQQIGEKVLAEEIGVGRTPVREALLKLQQENMVIIKPRAGTFVKPIEIETVNELYQLRKIIEPSTAVMVKNEIDPVVLLNFCDKFKEVFSGDDKHDFFASNKLDLEFHRYIISCTKNTRLIDFFTSMMESTYRISIYNALVAKSNPSETTYSEHYEIAQAIIYGDNDLIRKKYFEHLSQSQLASLEAARLIKDSSISFT